MWVRTARPLGRGMKWLGSKGAVTRVCEAKRWVEGRPNIRTAVRGRWLEWSAEEGTYQQGGGADGSGPPVPLSRESSTLGSEGGAVESCIGPADTANDGPGPALGERVQMSQNDVRNVPRPRGEGVEPEVEGPAATYANESRNQRTRERIGARGKDLGKKGTRGRPIRPGPQGAASVPSHPPPQPHRAQPQGERRSTRSRTGAPAKPREGIG